MQIQADVRKGLRLLFSLPSLAVPAPFFERMREIANSENGFVLTPDGACFLALLIAGNYTNAALLPYWEENSDDESFTNWCAQFPLRSVMLEFARRCLLDAAEIPFEGDFFNETDARGINVAEQMRDICRKGNSPDALQRLATVLPPEIDFRVTPPRMLEDN